jgi:hypothetical protein
MYTLTVASVILLISSNVVLYYSRFCYFFVFYKALAEVVELADALDSGSSVHCARAGSNPAFGTSEIKGFRVL